MGEYPGARKPAPVDLVTRSSGKKNRSSPHGSFPRGGSLHPLILSLLFPIAVADGDGGVRPASPEDGTHWIQASSSDEMVVEESGNTQVDPSNTSANVTVIEIDETLSGASDVASVVDSASGTAVLSMGGLGDVSAVSIRGSTLRQVTVCLDGIPLNPDGAQVINLSELPLAAFSRIEVYRGNAPQDLAVNPMGGVINLVTDREEVTHNTSASVGSYHTGRMNTTHSMLGEWGQQPIHGLMMAEFFGTRGNYPYFSDSGTIYNLFDDRITERDNNDKLQTNVLGRWRVGTKDRYISVLDTFLRREEGVPGHANMPAESTRLHTLRNLAALEGQTNVGAGQLKGRLWAQNRQDTFQDIEGEVGTGSQHQRGFHMTQGLLGRFAWAQNPWLSPGFTLSTRRDSYVETNLLENQTSNARIRWSGVGVADLQIYILDDKVTLSPLVQLTHLDNRALGTVPFSNEAVSPDTEQVITQMDPRLGLLWRPNETLSLKANAGHYIRPPDFSELFGNQGAVIGNTDLVPEQSWQWDVGARWVASGPQWLRGSVDLAHFWNSSEDLIVLVQNSQHTSVPINIGKAWVQGLETAVSFTFFDRLESQSNLTWTISRNLVETEAYANNELPRIAPWELYQGTSIIFGDDAWFRAGHTWNYTSPHYWDATNYYRSAPRSIHGAFARAKAGTQKEQFSLEASVLNLTNNITEVVPRNPLDETDSSRIVQSVTDFVGYPLAGRTWLLTLQWNT